MRCRPLSENEKRAGETPAVSVQGARTVTLRAGPRAHSYAQGTHDEDEGSTVFAFDHAFGPAADQLSIFAALGAPLVKELLAGYNATIFAYGQTGSGKTHTMIGTSLEPGLVPRTTWYLFERLTALGATNASHVSADACASRVPADEACTPHAVAPDALPTGDAAADDDDDVEGGGDAPSASRGGGGRTFRLHATYLQIYNESLIDMLGEGVRGGPCAPRGPSPHGLCGERACVGRAYDVNPSPLPLPLPHLPSPLKTHPPSTHPAHIQHTHTLRPPRKRARARVDGCPAPLSG